MPARHCFVFVGTARFHTDRSTTGEGGQPEGYRFGRLLQGQARRRRRACLSTFCGLRSPQVLCATENGTGRVVERDMCERRKTFRMVGLVRGRVRACWRWLFGCLVALGCNVASGGDRGSFGAPHHLFSWSRRQRQLLEWRSQWGGPWCIEADCWPIVRLWEPLLLLESSLEQHRQPV